MSEQVWVTLVVGLIGIILGGAGAPVVFKRLLKIPVANDDTSVTNAANSAASAAASTATAAALVLSNHLKEFQSHLDANTEEISALKVAMAGFTSACTERHKAIDKELARR